MSSTDLVELTLLMAIASGSSEIALGLIDRPMAMNHSALTTSQIRKITEVSVLSLTALSAITAP